MRDARPEHEIFDRRLALQRRDRVAHLAGQHDFLLQRVADDVMERLSVTRRTFPVVLDLGARHGVLGQRLLQRPGTELVIHTEASARLLAEARQPAVRADEEALPFRNESLDLVVSGLTLHLTNDLPGALIQIRRALKPDGLFLAALLGGDTLIELRQSLLQAEEELEGGASPRVAPFADVRDLGALLQRAQFTLPVVDSERVEVTYADPLRLMRDIRGMGCTNTMHARRRLPLRRETLARACAIYQERFGLENGRVPATFEILTMTGWAAHPNQQKPLKPGSAQVSLADALGNAQGTDEK